ncbi:hypothetical protein GGQ64_002413 [Rhizobium azooxidifex]|uniref:Concanavalin A-like lectin/glucanase superfamily protein n=1 Tax=Mycoplana azooxidifex TaxID=1636188 RepID=A0A7W6GJF4_9HYPH|nr:hypothetical protein [Mycoplana azooxidifex]MBB3977207.1 hypothetical protein [Mycoplana azooxidifex]
MATMRYRAAVGATFTDTVPYTAAELAFFNHDKTRQWWEAGKDNGDLIASTDRWRCRKSDRAMWAYAALKPLSLVNGGPDGKPIVKGNATGLPPDGLMSDTGSLVVNTSFCLWALAKAGTSAGAVLMSAIGDGGGGLALRLRSGNLVEARARVNDTTAFTRISQTLSSAAYHLVQLNYDHAAGQISVWGDGALLTGGTPSNGLFSYTHSFATTRVSAFVEYDTIYGDLDTPARNLEIACMGTATATAADSSWQSALLAMLDEKYPSLNLL